MTPTLYSKYELTHPNFKVYCIKTFSDFLGQDSWFSNADSKAFSPFQTEFEEYEMWKKYEITKSTIIRDKLISKYVWLVFRMFLSLNIDKYFRTKDEMFQEGLILLWKCILNFDITSDNSFYSYYCACMKHKFKTLRAMYMGQKVLNLSCYNIMDSRALMLENQDKYIIDSPLALKLRKNLGIFITKYQKVGELVDLINDIYFREPNSIYIKSPEDEETINIEDKLDYNYEYKCKFIEGRINELNKAMIYLYYLNANKLNKKHIIALNSLEYSLEILFYTCGFIKTENGFKMFADKTTQIEASDYFGFTKQGISVRLETLLKNLRICCDKKIIKDLLNGTLDSKDIMENIGEK